MQSDFSATPDPSATSAPAPAAADEITFFGVVGQHGYPSCLQGGSRTWLHVTPTIGSVRVGGVPEDEAARWMGKPVVAIGKPAPLPPAPPLELSECPPMQMRSDWVETPQGIRVQRGPVPDFDYFEVGALRAFTELSARLDGDDVVLELTNPLSVPATDLELALHYEGCYGKPGTEAKRKTWRKVAVGEVVTKRWPQSLAAPKAPRAPKVHVARAAVVTAQVDGVTFDLDVPLSYLGVSVDCP